MEEEGVGRDEGLSIAMVVLLADEGWGGCRSYCPDVGGWCPRCRQQGPIEEREGLALWCNGWCVPFGAFTM